MSTSIREPKSWRKKLGYILLVIFVCVVALAGITYFAVRHIGIEKLFTLPFLQEQIVKRAAPGQTDIFELVPQALGFDEPKTYLVLFLNNTELRPGGGFIGVYATVRLDRGNIEVLKVEGSEILDNMSSRENVPTPPDPLREYLKVSGWYFRDSNWSPDFTQSSKQALALYARENGVAFEDIDAVIGVTATVLEELMKKTGQLTVNGIVFTPENVIAELEHEVEYKYVDRGIARSDRKDIVEPFMHAIIDALKHDVLRHPFEYRALAEKLLHEKHLIAYAVDPSIQETLRAHAADGAVLPATGDYLMWVDANLGALKTDHAITRTLSYTIHPSPRGGGKIAYEATATMEYVHTHAFDWRTSRYLAYARVYVPTGATFISATVQTTKNQRTSTAPNSEGVQAGVELEKQWFGTFISVEPMTTGTISFTYQLPDAIAQKIDEGLYSLLAQKQIGLVGARLTLDLDFDTTIKSASPSELSTEWGNDTYRIQMPFEHDQFFEVTLDNY